MIFFLLVQQVFSQTKCQCIDLIVENDCIQAGCFWKNQMCLQVLCQDRLTQEECERKNQIREKKYQCEWVDTYSFCQDNTTAYTNCSSVDIKQCNYYEIDDGLFCQEQNQECVEMPITLPCSKIKNEYACNNLDCIWANNYCNYKGCSMFKNISSCTFILNNNRQLVICSWDGKLCKELSTNNGIKCSLNQTSKTQTLYGLTNCSMCSVASNYYYYYNGKVCQQCNTTYSYSMMIIFLCYILL
ncbi:hypothetical protein pb186bvf_017387 [Paramecium bursaria]